jgi:hypothetical protein
VILTTVVRGENMVEMTVGSVKMVKDMNTTSNGKGIKLDAITMEYLKDGNKEDKMEIEASAPLPTKRMKIRNKARSLFKGMIADQSGLRVRVGSEVLTVGCWEGVKLLRRFVSSYSHG